MIITLFVEGSMLRQSTYLIFYPTILKYPLLSLARLLALWYICLGKLKATVE